METELKRARFQLVVFEKPSNFERGVIDRPCRCHPGRQCLLQD
jgi:hypothetical protein